MAEEQTSFNIGKSFGLDENHQPLDDYQSAISEISEVFTSGGQAAFDKFNSECTALKNTLSSLTSETTIEVTKLRQNSSELLVYLAGLVTPEIKNNEWLEQQVQELFKAAMNRYIASLQQLFQIEADLATRVAGVEQKLDGHLTTARQQLESYFQDLRSKNTDLVEMENGYRFGQALKAALNNDAL